MVQAVPSGALDRPLQYEKGVGPARAARLARLGLRTARDLLLFLPRRHEDRTQVRTISGLVPGEEATVRGRVTRLRVARPIRGPCIVTADLEDETGHCQAVWFNRRYLADVIREGMELVITGKVGLFRGKLQIAPEDYEIVRSERDTEALDLEDPVDLASGRLVPIYPLTEGLSQRFMRALAHRVVTKVAGEFPDILPGSLRAARRLLPVGEAFREAHFPSSPERLAEARRRLAYEELFVLQTGLALVRARSRLEMARSFEVTPEIDARIRARLPFALTRAQERVVAEIAADLARGQPMNRLLQGDVGSGKTAVAVYAMLAVVAHRAQAAVMAPTELLAIQHAKTLGKYLRDSRVKVALLVGGIEEPERRKALADAASGRSQIVVGTHALLEESVRFANLGLVVMDEQHKFGVLQRARLCRKGASPHVLVMTATPIPRTLAMAYYGDLDLSVIDELPPGRGGVETRVVPEGERASAYARAREAIERGAQCYVVCPRVEEGEIESFDLEEGPPGAIRAAAQTRDRLARGCFKGIEVGLLHGRMEPEEKRRAMEDFASGRTRVLVCTVVVEVGIDVPEATVLVVEHADRFGLAQLHQLRGRVARSPRRGECYLIADPKTPGAVERLKALEETTDGFKISEADYRIRGPGEFFGTRQSGLPELRFADIFRDSDILAQAREDAFRLVAADPLLAAPEWQPLRRRVAEVLGERVALGAVG